MEVYHLIFINLFILLLSSTVHASQQGEVTSTNSTNSNNSTSLADAFAILIEKARHAASQKEETELEEPLNMNNSSLILDLEERLPVPRTSSVETQRQAVKVLCWQYCLKNTERAYVVKKCAKSKNPYVCVLCRRIIRCNNNSAFL